MCRKSRDGFKFGCCWRSWNRHVLWPSLERTYCWGGSSSFRSSQGHPARIEETLTPPSGRRPGEQLTIEEGLGAQWRSNLDTLWARCFFARGWAFNGVRSPEFIEAVRTTSLAPLAYTPRDIIFYGRGYSMMRSIELNNKRRKDVVPSLRMVPPFARMVGPMSKIILLINFMTICLGGWNIWRQRRCIREQKNRPVDGYRDVKHHW